MESHYPRGTPDQPLPVTEQAASSTRRPAVAATTAVGVAEVVFVEVAKRVAVAEGVADA